MCSTTDVLASYLADTQDASGVVAFIREKLPKSLSSYLSQVKKQWMTLDVQNPTFPEQFATALQNIDTEIATLNKTEKAIMLQARARLLEFKDMSLVDKNAVQRLVRSRMYSGHCSIDDAITNFIIFPAYIDKLKVTFNARNALQKKAVAALEAKSVQSITVQASDLISACRATLREMRPNAFDLAAALGLLTGRRTVEIFKTGVLSRTDDEHVMSFSGQAKRGELAENVAYEIPVLADPKQILSAIGTLRALKDCSALANREVNLRYSNSCNSAARRLLGEGRQFHNLRSIYAVIAHHCCLPHRYSLKSFIARVLGHQGLGTSLHYSSINVEPVSYTHLTLPTKRIV